MTHAVVDDHPRPQRRLDPLWPVDYVEAQAVNVREQGDVETKAARRALGSVLLDGRMEDACAIRA